jgi:hypothetical protein
MGVKKMSVGDAEERVARSPVERFGFPHLVVDDLLPVSMLAEINHNWPSRTAFSPEIKGIHIAHELAGDFWVAFSDDWRRIVSACAARLAGIIRETHFGLACGDAQVALMEADETFVGHGRHTHFYHNPNWVLTALFYADIEDLASPGTTIERINASDPAAVAMQTFRWHEGQHTFEAREIAYRPNRLLVFLDGPLAFHSVVTKCAQTTRRRIIRSHIAVDWKEFAARSGLPEIEQPEYARLMTADTPPPFLAKYVRCRVAAHDQASAVMFQ